MHYSFKQESNLILHNSEQNILLYKGPSFRSVEGISLSTIGVAQGSFPDTSGVVMQQQQHQYPLLSARGGKPDLICDGYVVLPISACTQRGKKPSRGAHPLPQHGIT